MVWSRIYPLRYLNKRLIRCSITPPQRLTGSTGQYSDASVKDLKGDSRPINNLQDRMTMLAALACVDWVVDFNESTPEQLIEAVLPNILVKGGDYKAKEVAGYQAVTKAGGQVIIADFVNGYSTSSTIKRINSTDK